MADPYSRRHNQMSRMRQRLAKKREALADFFDFKLFIAFVFKDPKKGSALFEATEVIPVMTNNYEDKIIKGVERDIYSYESSRELLDKDVVQLHVPRYASMRKDVLGCTQDMDFFLWPRGDLLCIRCFVFSRWKDASKIDEPFRLVQADFMFFSSDYELQLRRLSPTPIAVTSRSLGGEKERKAEEEEEQLQTQPKETRRCCNVTTTTTTTSTATTTEKTPKEGAKEDANSKTNNNNNNNRADVKQPGLNLRGGKDLIVNNADESIFLFVNRVVQQHDPSKPAIFKLNGICLYLPQDLLMCWGLGSVDEVLRPFMS